MVAFRWAASLTAAAALVLVLASAAAADGVTNAGDVPAGKLVPGVYRLRAVLADAAGRRHTFYALLTVVGRRHTPATRSTR